MHLELALPAVSCERALSQPWYQDTTSPGSGQLQAGSELLSASKHQAELLTAAHCTRSCSCAFVKSRGAHRENNKSTGQSQPILGETACFSIVTHTLLFTTQEQVPYVVSFEHTMLFIFFLFQCEYISGKKNTVTVSAVHMSTLTWVVEGSHTMQGLKS